MRSTCIFKLPRYLLIVLSALLLSSCFVSGPVHFYEGAPRPNQETVKLLVPGPITVKRIDGRELDVPSIEEGYYEIYLLPGVHRIEFRYELFWGDPVSGNIVTTDDEAFETLFNLGKEYEITYQSPQDADEAIWQSWNLKARIIEKETNRIINPQPVELLEEKGIKSELNSKSDSQSN